MGDIEMSNFQSTQNEKDFNESESRSENEQARTIFHVLLAILITFLIFVVLNFGIPLKVLVLLCFSIVFTFSAVFFCVWCLRVLEEKRIIELSRQQVSNTENTLLATSKKSLKKYKSTFSVVYSPDRERPRSAPESLQKYSIDLELQKNQALLGAEEHSN